MMMRRIARALAPVLFAATALPALANSANTALTAGSAGGQVIAPIQVSAVDMLRFGSFVQPQTGGTITVSPAGVVTTTGDLTTAATIAQPSPRGAASFKVTGEPGLSYSVVFTSQAWLYNATTKTDRLTLSLFRVTPQSGRWQLDSSGNAAFNFGATLTITAAQPVGVYVGAFGLLVQYN